jgi:aspartyl protease family protein
MNEQPIYMRFVFPVIVIALAAIAVAGQVDQSTKRAASSPLSTASDSPAASPADQISPHHLWSTPWGEVRIPVGAGGHYWTAAEINGGRIGALMVDTGASMVFLTYEDAETAGVFPGAADFNVPVRTANGIGRAARARLRLVRVGDLFVENVDAMVAQQGVLSTSLLGMSFLSRLRSFEATGGALVLRR